MNEHHDERFSCPCGCPEVEGHGWCEECLPFVIGE